MMPTRIKVGINNICNNNVNNNHNINGKKNDTVMLMIIMVDIYK